MSTLTNATTDCAVIAVIGGAIMDLVFEAERMPDLDESLDALSLAYKPGSKGSNTAVAIYRAQHPNPAGPGDNVTSKLNTPNSNADPEINALTNRNTTEKKIEIIIYLNTTVGEDTFDRDLKKSLECNGVRISGIRTSSPREEARDDRAHPQDGGRASTCCSTRCL